MDTIATRGTWVLHGIVTDGLGEAAHFMLMKWFRSQCRERLGINPSPGTFNLRMQGEHWQRLRPQLHHNTAGAHPALPVIHLAPPAGFCAASCYPVHIAGAIDAWAIVPHIGHYPHDKLEVIAPVNLRAALGVANGAAVNLAFNVTAPLAQRHRTAGEQA
ncbi:MAG: CTP-dependent riboflavin kinase [Rhodocyclales bacterium]|nr:CTP-dependent riboflavin kinase [Rhodocyclales bacterium]